MDVILVESPTKARTLGKFLGNTWRVAATYGHIRDLPERKIGIDIEHDFEPTYVQTDKQKEKIKEIKELTKEADTVYLATDPDREGEAIAWHVSQLLNPKKTDFKRIVFHEITKSAISEALAHPRSVDMPLVDAQQARRILDRLVGYKLSPLLWKKVRRGLSAGRVQSVAVRLVVEKEREIEKFVPVEYWTIQVTLQPERQTKFVVQLAEKAGEKYSVGSEAEASEVTLYLEKAAYEVKDVIKREIKKSPSAPFTTSTLQQTAANKLGWSAKRTMQVAQSLYEEGFITYHRTDSTNIAEEALVMCKEFLLNTFGQEYILPSPRIFKTKNKVAQEAHEAIRPTNVSEQPHSAGVVALNRDQQRMYDLVWKRFVASQMPEARGEGVRVLVHTLGDIEYGLEAKGETILFDGFLKVHTKTKQVEPDEEAEMEEEKVDEQALPELTAKEKLNFIELFKEQKFTLPPARYNDASLIKALEEMGIGRPSTYAPTLTTIQDRRYVEKIDKRFRPTALGIAVNDFLVGNFADIVNYEFTSNMEDRLDEIADGKRKWIPTLKEFYAPFAKELEQVGEHAARVKIEVETTGETCPQCQQGEVIVRIGKFGKFLSCSRYPDCDYKANYQNKIGVKCPKCTTGDVIMRQTKKGKSFYGCSRYPDCDFASWNKPTPTS